MINHIILGTKLLEKPKGQAFIYLDTLELEHLEKHLPDTSFLTLGKNRLSEKQLELILYYLPKDSFFKDYLQKAGQNIYGWKKW